MVNQQSKIECLGTEQPAETLQVLLNDADLGRRTSLAAIQSMRTNCLSEGLPEISLVDHNRPPSQGQIGELVQDLKQLIDEYRSKIQQPARPIDSPTVPKLPTVPSERLKFATGFDNVDGLRPSGNDTVRIFSTGDHDRGKAARFVLDRASDDVPYRTELETKKEDRLDFGKEYSIEFANRLVDWKKDKSPEIIFQLHAIPKDDDWDKYGKVDGKSPTNPDVTLRTRDGRFELTSNRKVIWSAPYEEGEWNDWKIKMRVAGDGDEAGYLDLYRNGEKVASVKGPNVHSLDNFGRPLEPQVFAKIGVYKWDWKDGRPATDTTRRVIDYDYFRIREIP